MYPLQSNALSAKSILSGRVALTMVNLEQKLMEFGELFLAAMGQSSLEQGTLDAGGNNKDDQGREGGSRGAGASPSGSMRPETPAPWERGLVEQMEEEVREAGLGGWFNGMDQGVLESWSGPNSDMSELQDRVRMTLLTTIGGHTLPNLVRVPDNLITPTVLRPLMEGPLRLWQFLVYSEMSPPYTEDLLVLHSTSPSHVFLQVGPYYEDLDGEYWGGVAEEGEEGREVEIENEGQDASIEL